MGLRFKAKFSLLFLKFIYFYFYFDQLEPLSILNILIHFLQIHDPSLWVCVFKQIILTDVFLNFVLHMTIIDSFQTIWI